MTDYLLVPLVQVVFTVLLLAAVLVKGKPHVARRPFAFFLASMSLWGLFIFLMRHEANLATALVWERFVFVGILSAALFFYRFTNSLTGASPRRYIYYAVHLAYIISLGLVPTSLVVREMQVMWYGKAPVVGPLFAFYVGSIYLPLVLSLVTLIKHARHTTSPTERTRSQYIAAGLIVMFIGGTTDYLPPLGINMYPLGIIGNIVFCGLATVAMLHYDMLEMKVVLRRGIAYGLAGALLVGIFVGLVMLLGSVFQTPLSPISLTIAFVSVLVTVVAVTLFQPVVPAIQNLVDRWFLRERFDHLQALKRFPEETQDISDLKQLGSAFVTAVANGMQSRAVFLLLPSARRKGEFVTHSYYGTNRAGQLAFQESSLLTMTLKYEDAPVDTGDAELSPTLSVLTEQEQAALARRQIELLVPLKARNQLIGMLLLASKHSGKKYSTEDRRLLHRVAREVAANIDNILAYENIQQEHGQLLEALDGIIHAMSLVVETRDPYTAGHQKRVADIACAIAGAMGLSEWAIRGIRVAGLLHDVGKLSVPAEILSRPGRLTPSEFAIIRSHPRVSYDILEMIEFPWPVKEAVLQHHERLDGSGYPSGLSGEDICLEARILGVADVVEAISSHRPYRPALGLEYAMREILNQKGILYDPKVVDACLKLFSEKDSVLEQLQETAGTRG